MYSQLETHGVPEPIIEMISKKVHRSGWDDVSTNIQTLYTPFEKIVLFNDALPDMVEHYYENDTATIVFIKFSNTWFAQFYNYNIEGVNETIIMEGNIQGNHVSINRFYRNDTWEHEKHLTTHVEDYFKNKISPDEEPFKMIHSIMLPRDTPFDMKYFTDTTLTIPVISKKFQMYLFNSVIDYYMKKLIVYRRRFAYINGHD
jgi:hypothetical protein